MAFIPVPDFCLSTFQALTSGLVGAAIDASGEKFAVIFTVPKTGSIVAPVYRVVAAATPETLRVSLQTVGADGLPTGSAYGGMTAGTHTPAANTNYEPALGTAATAVKGDLVAFVVEFDSAIGNVTIAAHTSLLLAFPYMRHYTSAWAEYNGIPVFAIKYSDGSYVVPAGCFPPSDLGLAGSASSTSEPDERALRFKIPVTARCTGANLNSVSFTATTGSFDVVLYDPSGSVIATRSVDPDEWAGNNNQRPGYIHFADSPTITAGEFYRLAVKSTGAGTVNFRLLTSFAGVFDNPEFTGYYSHRFDSGSWTNVTTQRPIFEPVFNAIDIPAGGGGGGSFSFSF